MEMTQSNVPVSQSRLKIFKPQHLQTVNYKGLHRNRLLQEAPHVCPAQ